MGEQHRHQIHQRITQSATFKTSIFIKEQWQSGFCLKLDSFFRKMTCMTFFSYINPFYQNASMRLSNMKLFLLLHFYLYLALGCAFMEVSLTASCSCVSVPPKADPLAQSGLLEKAKDEDQAIKVCKLCEFGLLILKKKILPEFLFSRCSF